MLHPQKIHIPPLTCLKFPAAQMGLPKVNELLMKWYLNLSGQNVYHTFINPKFSFCYQIKSSVEFKQSLTMEQVCQISTVQFTSDGVHLYWIFTLSALPTEQPQEAQQDQSAHDLCIWEFRLEVSHQYMLQSAAMFLMLAMEFQCHFCCIFAKIIMLK